MKIDILTIFPEMFRGPFDESIIKRAQDKGLVEIRIHDLRRWAGDRHKSVDDRPYGGGPGMVMRVDVINSALQSLKSKVKSRNSKVILLTPQGKVFNQQRARELSSPNHLILIAGHYEGVDERVREHLVDEEISIGDYVLTGGELPAMVVVDAVVRLIPGVLSKKESVWSESFSNYSATPVLLKSAGQAVRGSYSLLEGPQYTRPENFKGWNVPSILLSGNHAEIARWREAQAIKRTRKERPDLLR